MLETPLLQQSPGGRGECFLPLLLSAGLAHSSPTVAAASGYQDSTEAGLGQGEEPWPG